MCKVIEKYPVGNKTQKDKFKSHVLITNRRIYYFNTKSRKSPVLQYFPLELSGIKKDNSLHFSYGLKGIYFTLIIADEYESREVFNERKKKFDATMIPILIGRYNEYIKETEGEDLKLFARGYRKKIIKRIPKLEERLQSKYS
jgi:hypothetical protein